MSIKTFVFLDIEATGLPSLIGGLKPRVTQLSFLAVHRHSLLGSSHPPRVKDKLTICVYPMKPISAGASSLTGLTNDNLLFHKDFDPDLVHLIKIFLRRHETPICFVAHNGLKFDFPLLQSEFKSLGEELNNVLIVDSLKLFEQFENTKGNESNIINRKGVKRKLEYAHSRSVWIDDSLKKNEMESSQKGSLSTNVTKVGNDPKSTPVSEISVASVLSCNTSPNFSPKYTTSLTPPRTPRRNLSALYSRYIGHEPVGTHDSEVDCELLLSVCHSIAQAFCQLADEMAINFNDVKEMYAVNKRTCLEENTFPYQLG